MKRVHKLSEDAQNAEVEFNLGYLYRTIEEHIDRFAAQAGGACSVADIADRVGQALRLKAKNVRTSSGIAELLQQVREDGKTVGKGAGNQSGGKGRKTVHVRPRSRRPLSAAARKRIGAAQRKRWREYARKRREQKRLERMVA